MSKHKHCECGCGARVKKRFVSGHNILGRNNPAFRKDVNIKKSKSQKRVLAERKKNNPKEHKSWIKHLRQAMKKRFNTPGIREWYSRMMADKWKDEKFVKAYIKASPRRHASLKRTWANCSTKERAIWVRNAATGAARHPNTQESKLSNILNKYFPGKFIMNVVNCVTVGHKIPDFIGTKDKVVIELFGTYWHSEKKTGREKDTEEYNRINYFRKYKMKTIIIWENELKNKKLIISKVSKVLKSLS